jgi:hypothetical protein
VDGDLRLPAEAQFIALGLICRDAALQPRAAIQPDLIDDYASALLDGAQFPPVTLFHDGEVYWLADGYHRADAAERTGQTDILADVRQGTRRDAILFSFSANATHGLRRSNEDKRRAVLAMLDDPEWASWSDREIARQCAVSHDFVNRLRPSVIEGQIAETRTVTRGGTTYEMNTARIGKPEPEPPPDLLSQARAEGEAAVRAEIADKLVISEADLAERLGQIDATYSQEIERVAEERDRALANVATLQTAVLAAPASPAVAAFDSNTSFRAMCIEQAARTLKAELKITPRQLIDIEREMAATLHQRPDLAETKLAELRIDAAAIRAWLDEFLAELDA